MRGKSQIWSLRMDDGQPLATLETRVRVGMDGRRDLIVVQLRGLANAPAPEAARRTVDELLQHMCAEPHQMDGYLAWRQKVLRKNLDQRQQHALVQPIIMALEKVLPAQFAWQKLVGTS